MHNEMALFIAKQQALQTVEALEACNDITLRYGLSLTLPQMQQLAQRRFAALEETGRVEFAEGILPKLALAFCDSPYLMQEEYADTLAALQDLFYYFKGEAHEQVTDDELIAAMKEAFDGRAQGSLEYLGGTSLEQLCHNIRFGDLYDDE
ncbi:MAG: DUF6323 family protein [Eubacteriales bacterium]|nr:DUF6323 family protein [Eubacteriales bacterium]